MKRMMVVVMVIGSVALWTINSDLNRMEQDIEVAENITEHVVASNRTENFFPVETSGSYAGTVSPYGYLGWPLCFYDDASDRLISSRKVKSNGTRITVFSTKSGK